jgi:predicted ATPase/DNA-binding XRE family transcriptional regulator
MKVSAPGPFGAHLKALREAAGYTQEELATIAGLSVHAVSALERGERRRPHVDTVRALSAALDLTGSISHALLASARAPAEDNAVSELTGDALPLPPTALLGRESDMQTLRQWLADPAVRLITLLGPGGVGKTRLALELAHAIAVERSIRVVFVPLAVLRDPGFVASAIAGALGLTDVTAINLSSRARVACADHPTLLVLDNFEHVLDAAPLVADLLLSVPSLLMLTTSRAPLHVRGEREYVLGPLSLEGGVDATSPADLARIPAVQLFVERVRDVQPGFQLTADNGRGVMAICRRLDALPLALELAAPWMKALTADDLLRRLDHDTLLSTGGPRDLPERQQTMNAAVAWSYHLLAPDEQRAFRRFGALPSRFSIDAAAAVLAGPHDASAAGVDPLTPLAGLIDKSLLLRTDTAVATRPLYQMLETVRAYATRELVAASEHEDAVEGLVRYCTREASLAAEGLVSPDQGEWLDRVHDDLESYREALTWLIEGGRAAEASEIASGLMFFWWIRGHAPEGLQWYEQTLNLPSLPPAAESRALLGAAAMYYAQGGLERARTALTRARALAHAGGDMNTLVRTADLSARVEWGLGNLQAARDWFTNSIEGFQTLAIPWGTGNALIGMSGLALESDDPDYAERLLREATSVLRHAGPWFQSRALFVRAILAVGRGDADGAIALVRESLTRIRDLQDKYAFVHALVPLAAAAALKGDDAWAARILGARDAVLEHTGATVVVKPVHVLKERAEQAARARLSPDRWARAYAAGRSASIDALLKDIDRIRA